MIRGDKVGMKWTLLYLKEKERETTVQKKKKKSEARKSAAAVAAAAAALAEFRWTVNQHRIPQTLTGQLPSPGEAAQRAI